MKHILLGLALLGAAPVLHAQDYDSLVRNALELRNSGDLAGAEARLREAWPLASDKSEVAYLLGMVLAFQQRFQEGQALITAALADHPGNLDLQLGQARILAFQGQHDDAASAVAALLQQHPGNTEAINLAGRIALYQSSPQRALDYFESVLAAEPDNLEALVGRHDAALALGEAAVAEAALQRAEAVAPQHVDVLTRRNPDLATPGLQHEASIGFGHSDISRSGFGRWNDRFVEYRHLHADRDQEYLRASHSQRFGRHDTQLEAGLLLNQDQAWPLELSAGFADSADFVADWFVRTGTRRLLKPSSDSWGALVFTPVYQYSSFDNGDTQRLLLGFEYYVPDSELWLAPSLGLVRDQDGIETFAWSLGAHWQASVRHRIGGSYSDAPETENLLTTDTKSYSAYWRFQLADAWALLLVATHVDRSPSYKRDEYNLVLQHRF